MSERRGGEELEFPMLLRGKFRETLLQLAHSTAERLTATDGIVDDVEVIGREP